MNNIVTVQKNEIPNVDLHTSCHCYQHNRVQTIRHMTFTKGETIPCKLDTHNIIFVTEGTVRVSVFNMAESVTIGANEFIFLPIGTRVQYETLEKGAMVVFSLDKLLGSVPECHTFRFQRASSPLIDKKWNGIYALKANDRICTFIDLTLATESDGLKCSSYARLLIGQLMYLIQIYYPQDEYTLFYSSILSPDVVFSDFVYENWKKHPVVHELAGAFNMTAQQFTIRFRRVFGEAPGAWIKKRRAEVIYHDICTSYKSLKEIAVAHNLDMSNFIRYCRMNYGLTPGAIREQLKVEISAPDAAQRRKNLTSKA